MAIHPRKRGLLKTILNKPFNTNLLSKNKPGPIVGGIPTKKFTPNALSRRKPIIPDKNIPLLKGFKSGPDKSYTTYNTNTKVTTKFNVDGTRFRKARPKGRRVVPAGAGSRGFRVIQEK